jgi:hypothetical protein
MEDRLLRLDKEPKYLRLAEITVDKMTQQGKIPASKIAN